MYNELISNSKELLADEFITNPNLNGDKFVSMKTIVVPYVTEMLSELIGLTPSSTLSENIHKAKNIQLIIKKLSVVLDKIVSKSEDQDCIETYSNDDHRKNEIHAQKEAMNDDPQLEIPFGHYSVKRGVRKNYE